MIIKKIDEIQIVIGFIMLTIGLFMIFNYYHLGIEFYNSIKHLTIVEQEIAQKYYAPKSIYGFWIYPLCIGIILFLEPLIPLPNLSYRYLFKRFKKYWIWKIKELKKD